MGMRDLVNLDIESTNGLEDIVIYDDFERFVEFEGFYPRIEDVLDVLDWVAHDYYGIVCDGQVGRWNGRYQAGAVCDEFKDFFGEAFKDCDYIKIVDEKGHLKFYGAHHDGLNYFECRLVTRAGHNFIQDRLYLGEGSGDRVIVELLFSNNKYSIPVNFCGQLPDIC